ncbi:MAG: hypothetical protein H6765_10115 [Candidatus Peribacteria bacterium]|nr:MAG: hypothetical protein H6765_10115 [Candidatus Peribacteria bacterium]
MSSFCSATEEFCGDGDVNGAEECDDDNGVNGDGCDNDCTISNQPPTITNIADQSTNEDTTESNVAFTI